MLLNKDNITILSASEVPADLLIDFYKKVYSERLNYLETNWKWLNRSSFYRDRIPLVLVYENQVIAHSGMIPFNISIDGKLHSAAWFIDFIILPEFERQGLGSILIKKWISFSDCCLAIGCSNKSLGAFKKAGWIESRNTFLHINFIHPFNHPGFVRKLPLFLRKFLNFITYPALFLIYNRHSYSEDSYKLYKLDESSFYDFFNLYTIAKKVAENCISPFRDIDYANWRVLNSPNREKYYLYKTNKFGALVSLNDNHGEYIDILWVSDNKDKKEIVKMISTLGVYGMRKGLSYIRFYTSDNEMSDFIKKEIKSIVQHPLFMFFSVIPEVKEKLKISKWDWELIDNDFEHIK